tara:strand:- start:2576 stop:4720 length:2145 start_codon:yes stop_codon:yes gene_type:complete
MDNKEKDFLSQPINVDRFINSLRLGIFRIALALFGALCLWAYYYSTVERTYGVASLLQIKESTSSTISIEDLMGGGNENINLNEEITIFLSNTSLLKLIDQMQLNILIDDNDYEFDKSEFIEIPIFDYFNNFVKVDSISEEMLSNQEFPFSLNLEKTSNGFMILDKDFPQNELNFGKLYEFEKFNLKINHINGLEIGENVQLNYYPKTYFIDTIKNLFTINPVTVSNLYWNQGSLVSIFVESNNPEFAMKIIQNASDLYIQNSVAYNVAEAERSLGYITDQITRVEKNLKDSEKKLNDFQSFNTTINFELEVQSIIDQSAILNNQIVNLVARKTELLSLYLPSNNIIKSLDNQIYQITSQLDSLEQKIQGLPKTQQKYLQLSREVTLNKNIYETLLEKRIEFSLMEASTIGNARVIDSPYITGKMSPRFLKSLLITVIASLSISIIFTLLSTLFFDKIFLPSEIRSYDKSLNILGMVPDFNENKPTKIDDFNLDSMQAIGTNINLIAEQMNQDNTTVEIISATESIGKSSVSLIISNNLSLLNKKVLLLDLDLYKGRLGKFFDKENSISVEQFNSMNSFNDLKVKDNLFFMPRIKMSKNDTTTFLESPAFIDFINRAKDKFDFIIMDTPPMLYKSDGISLSKHADLVLPVLRQKESRLSHIRQLKDIMALSGVSFSYIIFNGIKKLAGTYYSNYDYSAYYYYGYDYDYGDDKDV